MKCIAPAPRYPHGLLQPGQKVTVTTLISDLEGGSRSEPGEVVYHQRGHVGVKLEDGQTLRFVASTKATNPGRLPLRTFRT